MSNQDEEVVKAPEEAVAATDGEGQTTVTDEPPRTGGGTGGPK